MKRYIPLGDVISKSSVERCGERQLPILSITMKDGLVLQDEKFKKRIASADTTEYKVIPRGKLVQGIHIDEANFGIQNIVEEGIVSPAYKVWDVNSRAIHPKYLEMIMRSPRSLSFYKSKLNGSVNRRGRMTDDDFLGMLIPYVDYPQQENIIRNIDQAKSIVELYQHNLGMLDDLIKARFVEMFVGKGHPMIALDDLSLGKGEYGAQSASVAYDPKRPRYVRITDINDDGTLNDDVVSSANIEDDEQYILTYGDFMFARMGATVGKTYAYKTGNQIFAGYLIRYRLNLSIITPEYLFAYTQLDEYKNWVVLNQSGAAQPGINAKKYGSLKIPVAPMDMQRAFQDFVSQVDKSKVVGWTYRGISRTKMNIILRNWYRRCIIIERLDELRRYAHEL